MVKAEYSSCPGGPDGELDSRIRGNDGGVEGGMLAFGKMTGDS